MLGFEFENNSEPYAVFNIVQSIAVLVFAFVEAFIVNRTLFFTFNTIIGVIGLVFCGFTLLFKFKEVNGAEKTFFKSKSNDKDGSIYLYSSGIRLDESMNEDKNETVFVEDLQPILNGAE